MKKSLLIILVIGVVILIAMGILLWHQKSRLITGFLGLEYDPLDINKDKEIDQRDFDKYVEFYQQGDLRADFNKNGKLEYDDAIQYTLLFRNK